MQQGEVVSCGRLAEGKTQDSFPFLYMAEGRRGAAGTSGLGSLGFGEFFGRMVSLGRD